METDITRTKELIRKQVKRKNVAYHGLGFTKYAKVYPYTNENIKGYLDLADLSNCDSALTVLASGDQAFNLISHGIYNIDTFDVNRLTEYYSLGFKRAMISNYSYEDYLEFEYMLGHLYYSIDKISQTIIDLLPDMDEKYRKFWREIVDYNYALQKNVERPINLFDMLLHFDYQEARFNKFLESEESFLELKKNLSKANITFKECDVLTLKDEFKGLYDIIMLSNILDYMKTRWGNNWDAKHLVDLIANLYCITKDEALIFLKYSFYSDKTVFRDAGFSEFKFVDGIDLTIDCRKKGFKTETDAMYLIRKKES